MAAQWAALAKLTRHLCEKYSVPARFAQAVAPGKFARGILGHRDFSPDRNGNGHVEPFEWLKECPGFDVEAWLKAGMVPDPKHVIEVP